MSDILEEILREQSDAKKLKYFKKSLPIIIILTILVVVYMLMNNWRTNKGIQYNKRQGDILIKSIAQDNSKELTLKSLKTLEASSNRIKEIAMLKEVGIKITDKNIAEAKILLEKIIDNRDNITASYARLSWLSLAIDETELSEKDNEKFKKYLDYFTDENKEFYGMVNIIKALWYVKNGKMVLAQDFLKKTISMNSSVRIVKEQAKALLANIERDDTNKF
jgi:hypothetical protein